MIHKEDARPVEGEWKHLLWKIFKQEKREDRERERERERVKEEDASSLEIYLIENFYQIKGIWANRTRIFGRNIAGKIIFLSLYLRKHVYFRDQIDVTLSFKHKLKQARRKDTLVQIV